MINLKELEQLLDNALEKETNESLTNYLNNLRTKPNINNMQVLIKYSEIKYSDWLLLTKNELKPEIDYLILKQMNLKK